MAPHTNDAIPIADCSRIEGFISMDEMLANAALMCAAPTMYYALIAALGGVEGWRVVAQEAIGMALLLRGPTAAESPAWRPPMRL